MTTKTKKQMKSDELMKRLVFQAETDFNSDRRTEPRFPFFRPVSIRVGDLSFSAFTREISASAMGLLHNMLLPCAEVEIWVEGHRPGLRARIERCEPCGEGWFISGCKIVRTSDS